MPSKKKISLGHRCFISMSIALCEEKCGHANKGINPLLQNFSPWQTISKNFNVVAISLQLCIYVKTTGLYPHFLANLAFID